MKICQHTDRFRRQEKSDRLAAKRKTSQSLGSIRGLKTGGNITAASSWKETPTEEEFKAVNINSANAGIEVGEEDDSLSVQSTMCRNTAYMQFWLTGGINNGCQTRIS